MHIQLKTSLMLHQTVNEDILQNKPLGKICRQRTFSNCLSMAYLYNANNNSNTLNRFFRQGCFPKYSSSFERQALTVSLLFQHAFRTFLSHSLCTVKPPKRIIQIERKTTNLAKQLCKVNPWVTLLSCCPYYRSCWEESNYWEVGLPGIHYGTWPSTFS